MRNVIKIGPYLPKLLQEKFGAVFFGPPCIYHNCATAIFQHLFEESLAYAKRGCASVDFSFSAGFHTKSLNLHLHLMSILFHKI